MSSNGSGRGKYMSQKSITYPCTDVKFSKPVPKLTRKLSRFLLQDEEKSVLFINISYF